MKPAHVAANLEQANLKLSELVAVEFRDYELEDLVFDALAVTRALDGKRAGTAIFCHPRGDAERSLVCFWPAVSEAAHTDGDTTVA